MSDILIASETVPHPETQQSDCEEILHLRGILVPETQLVSYLFQGIGKFVRGLIRLQEN